MRCQSMLMGGSDGVLRWLKGGKPRGSRLSFQLRMNPSFPPSNHRVSLIANFLSFVLVPNPKSGASFGVLPSLPSSRFFLSFPSQDRRICPLPLEKIVF